jgi:type II secretory pathway pseudopilin PulG
MDSNQTSGVAGASSTPKTSAKDFFLNLGAIVALYTVVGSLISLLFTAINQAFPQINSGYGYMSSASISFPVANVIIFFPIFIFLTWFMAKGFVTEPLKRHLGIRRWLTYITLFIAGLVLAGDLVTVLYYFIDGQELTAGFLMKVFSVLVIIGMVFGYYITDIRDRLTKTSQMVWLAISTVVIVASIIYGFSVLGSPRSQRLIKYDEQKVSYMQQINNQVRMYYISAGKLPKTIMDIPNIDYYRTDPQTGKEFVYSKIDDEHYSICATFNKENDGKSATSGYVRIAVNGDIEENSSWAHPAGEYCFEKAISSKVIETWYNQPGYPKGNI